MADSSLVALLEQGPAVWNSRTAASHDRTPIDLVGADLQGLDLAGVSLPGADLSGARLRGARLERADLSGACLQQADLTEAPLNRSLLRGADLRGALGDTASFLEAAMTGVDARGARFPHSLFSGAVLDDAQLDGTMLQGGKFWGAKLRAASLVDSDVSYADFNHSVLHGARMCGANLEHTYFVGSSLAGADLSGARLVSANCQCADFTKANLRHADLTHASLTRSVLVGTNLEAAVLVACKVYGISAWDLAGTPARQESLLVSDEEGGTITVDDLETAQFIHLLLRRATLRKVIESVTSKAVLILGRFTPERKVVLEALAAALRAHDLVPIIFDFERATDRDLTETIKTLAGLSQFVVVDLTSPRSAPLELQATVPDYQLPFVSILQKDEKPLEMFNDLWTKFTWVLEPVDYNSAEQLVRIVKPAIIDRAAELRRQLRARKQQKPQVLSGDRFEADLSQP